jgi:hypothetical protein
MGLGACMLLHAVFGTVHVLMPAIEAKGQIGNPFVPQLLVCEMRWEQLKCCQTFGAWIVAGSENNSALLSHLLSGQVFDVGAETGFDEYYNAPQPKPRKPSTGQASLSRGITRGAYIGRIVTLIRAFSMSLTLMRIDGQPVDSLE